MDWDLAIKRNSEALKGIIEVLFALLGLDGTDAASRIPHSLHRAVLRVLRPAESAVRRLIVVAARGVVVKLAPSRPMPEGRKIGKGGGSRPPSFKLFDQPQLFRSPSNASEIHPACPAHPFLRLRSPDGSPVSSTPARRCSPAAARWPGQCQAPQPQAPGPQVRPRRPSPPGQAPGPLAGEAEGLAKAPKFTSPLRLRPSARPPEEAHSRDRRNPHRMRLARLGGDEARHKLKQKIIRLRINSIGFRSSGLSDHLQRDGRMPA